MSATAFTVDWNQLQDLEDEPEVEGSDRHDKEDQNQASENDGLAWNIDFSSSVSSPSKPRLPKFLRDREKLRAEKSRNDSAMSPVRSVSSGQERKLASSVTKSKSPMPLKAKSTPSMSPSSRPASINRTRPHTSPANRPQSDTRGVETSPKKSPAIKQPLLAVSSPRRGQSSPVDPPLALRSPRRTKSAVPAISPRKTAIKKDRQISSEATNSTSKTGRATASQRQMFTVKIPTGTQSDTHSQPKPKMALCPKEIEQRKVLDLKRWYCMCRPQYSKSCGISSVVSCWNYLFSTLGNGSHRPITQEEALTLLGFKPPFGEIRFGPFTGNATCMRWFQHLCCHYGVGGSAYYFYKPVGKGKTFGLKPDPALEKLKEGINDPSMAFIYHCLNHYFCPIGYEEVPKNASDAYKVNLTHEDTDTWVLIGEPSRKQSSIHCKRWTDIVTDLCTKRPEFFNIRHTERGVQSKRTKRAGGNLHCIMAFKKHDDTLGTIFAGPDIPPEPQELQQSLSEVENLDSSDSDFPLSPKSSNDDLFSWGVAHGSNGGAIEAVNAVVAELRAKDDIGTISIPAQDLEYEQVDAPDVDLSPTINVAGDDSSSDVPQIQIIRPTVSSPEKSSSTEAADIEEVHVDDSDTVSRSPKSSTRLRSGTYIIKQSSPVPDVISDDSDSESSDHQVSPSGAIRRTGTFTKDSKVAKPVIRRTRPPSVYSSDQDSELDDPSSTSDSVVQRAETFSKPRKLLHVPQTNSSDYDISTDSENEPPHIEGGLRRSGTFTKEKPEVIVSRVIDSESSGEEIATVATSRDNLELSTSYLTRSGTYTKKQSTEPSDHESDSSLDFEYIDGVDLNETLKAPLNDSNSDEDAHVEDSLELPTEQGSYLKRSGTFTKSKPFLKQ